MSQCDRVLRVLADGQLHSIEEIHARAGTMRLNSRIAELRKRGYGIPPATTGKRPDGKLTWFYRLMGGLGENGTRGYGPFRAPLSRRENGALGDAASRLESGRNGFSMESPSSEAAVVSLAQLSMEDAA